MGLLDSLLGGLMRGGTGSSQEGGSGMGGIGGAAILAIVLQLLQQNGGLQGLLRRMQQSGYGDQAQSWIGTGQNQPIPPDALSRIFGQGNLAQIARELGVSHDEAASTVAQALPEVVNQMTPDGAIPADHDDLVARTLEQLQRKGP